MHPIITRAVKYFTRFFLWGTAILLAAGFVTVGTSVAADRLPNITILATGGTIAGTASSALKTTEYRPGVLDVGELIKSVPGLDQVARISAEQVANIGSEDMTDAIMLQLARRAAELLARPEVDGLVITHGTDTMEETAYFLNLVIQSDKPVVFTGSMRPATALSADGPLNLFNAVLTAASPAARARGVLVALNEKIHAARNVTKTNTTGVETFQSPDFGCLGYVLDGNVSFYQTTTRRHTVTSEFTLAAIRELPRVDIIYGHAQGNRDLVDAAVGSGARGIIHAGVGDGNIFYQTRQALTEARKKGLIVVRSSRVGSGLVTRTADDQRLGFISADTLNPQKARILLMTALTRTGDVQEIERIFSEY